MSKLPCLCGHGMLEHQAVAPGGQSPCDQGDCQTYVCAASPTGKLVLAHGYSPDKARAIVLQRREDAVPPRQLALL